ncbi:MAG: hypothetical protein COA78_24840 [Blastopirellula sp.]|nr:MAG: hypothetical protein COA78_24840 [Blastopirellula sp.]
MAQLVNAQSKPGEILKGVAAPDLDSNICGFESRRFRIRLDLPDLAGKSISLELMEEYRGGRWRDAGGHPSLLMFQVTDPRVIRALNRSER